MAKNNPGVGAPKATSAMPPPKLEDYSQALDAWEGKCDFLITEGIGGLLFAVDRRWLVGAEEGREEASEVLADTLRRGAETFVLYGPVLRAISDAASQDVRVEEVYRYGLIERLVVSVAARIERDVEAGLSPDDLDPEETARALVLMTERYLLDAFGKPEECTSREKTGAVVEALVSVWVRTLYGLGP